MKNSNKKESYQTLGYTVKAPAKDKSTPRSGIIRGGDLRDRKGGKR